MKADPRLDPAALAADLIRIPTPPGEGDAAARHLAAVLGERGVACRLVAGGFVAVRGAGPRSLVLAAHLDTAATGGGWTDDPFGGGEGGGFLRGRGAADAKGPLASLVAAFARAAVPEGRGKLTLVAAPGGPRGTGLAALVGEACPDRSAAIVAAPTALRIGIAERGTGFCRLAARSPDPSTALGAGSSGAWPAGDSPVVRIARAIVALDALRFDRAHPLLGLPEVRPVAVEAGPGEPGWRPPAFGLATLACRTTPAYPLAAVDEAIERVVTPHAASEIVALGRESWEQDASSEIVALARTVLWGADLVAYSGVSGVAALLPAPAIVLGPGEAVLAPDPDERVAAHDLARAEHAYREIIEAYLRS